MPVQEYYLFLDESGEFMETSTNPREKRKGARQQFDSQLVGFLAPKRPGVAVESQRVINECFDAAKMKRSATFHAREDTTTFTLNAMIQKLVEILPPLNWQPVRLVNQEKISYGDRVTTYTNMVAELALRLFQEKAKHSEDRVILYFTGDLVALDEINREGHHKNIPKHEYKKRIDEYLRIAAVRRGLAKEQLKWDLPSITLDRASKIPALQICDLLSYASHADYRRCSPQTTPLLKRAFASYDQTMVTRDLLERVDNLIEEQTFGVALLMLAENMHDEDAHGYPREGARNRLQHILMRLTQIGVRGRDSHLAILIAWLDQLIGQQRLNKVGYLIANWLLENVDAPLRVNLTAIAEQTTIDWFTYTVRRWALTAANHAGALRDARGELLAMQQLQPSLARQWDRTPLLMDGFIVQSIHQTDSFDFKQAAQQMGWVADSLKLQSQSLQKLMPETLSEQLQYDIRAKALGTLLQCLTLTGFNDDEDLARARAISDEAIAEFSSLDDKARQYQYRCHMETIAMNFPLARKYLIKSLSPHEENPANISHSKLKHLLSTYPDKTSLIYRFALLHWLRIGAFAFLHGETQEQSEFALAIERSTLLESEWCTGAKPDWPAHSILRFVAVIQASHGMIAAALKTIQCLQDISPIDENHLILPVIGLAAQAEVATLIWNQPASRLLLDSEGQSRGCKQILELLLGNEVEQFPAMFAMLKLWSEKIELICAGKVADDEAQNSLLGLASEIRY
jgi:hypothetical protein